MRPSDGAVQCVAYAANLRLFAFIRDEAAFVGDMKGLPELLPPMLLPQAADLLEAVGIDQEPRKLDRLSDHTPIWARLAAA